MELSKMFNNLDEMEKGKKNNEDLLKKYENGKKWQICQNSSWQKNPKSSLYKRVKLVAIKKCWNLPNWVFQLQIHPNQNQITSKSASTNLETQNMISNQHNFWATIKTNFFPNFSKRNFQKEQYHLFNSQIN